MTDTRTLYIFGLRCIGAFRPSPEHNVIDAGITDEHWITDAVIDENQGLIRVRKIGLLKSELLSSTRFRIKRWLDAQTADPSSLNEMEHLWIVDESQDPSEWQLRDGVGLPDEAEETGDGSPLELPGWNWTPWPDSSDGHVD